MSAVRRIGEQLRRAFEGGAWHGPSLQPALGGLSARRAAWRPAPDVHSIWELVLHIAAWDAAVLRSLENGAVEMAPGENFPAAADGSEAAWHRALARLEEGNRRLRAAILRLEDADLGREIRSVEGTYSAYVLLHGVVQHDLYHTGQIVLLRRLAENGEP